MKRFCITILIMLLMGFVPLVAFCLSAQDKIVIERSEEKMKENESVIIEVKKNQILINGRPCREFKKNGVVVITTPSKHDNKDFVCPLCEKKEEDKNKQERPYLGVLSESIQGLNGALVKTVIPYSGAEVAGLQVGDVLIEANRIKVESQKDLINAIKEKHVGDNIDVSYTRNGKTYTTKCVLKGWKLDRWGNGDTAISNFVKERIKDRFSSKDMDFQQEKITDSKPFYLGMDVEIATEKETMGLKIVQILAGSLASRTGLKVGDIITQINNSSVSEDIAKSIRTLQTLQKSDVNEIELEIKRQNTTQKIKVPVYSQRISI